MSVKQIIILTGVVVALCATAVLYVAFTPRAVPSSLTQTANDSVPFSQISPQASAESDTPKLKLDTVASGLITEAKNQKSDWNVEPGARIIILPHHISAGAQIMGALDSLISPSVIYLIARDPADLCPADFCLTSHGFETSVGALRGSPDHTAIILSAVPKTQESADAFTAAGPISYLLPFIANHFNGARVVPIYINRQTSAENYAVLSDALTKQLSKDPGAVIVAALESNRVLMPEVASFHDITTKDIIRSLADLEAEKADVDSPELLTFILKTARNLNLGQVSVESTASSSVENTSTYFFSWFYPGQIQQQEKVTLLFLGDIMLDRFVAERSRRAGSKEYPFQLIMGSDKKFFYGQDAVIANLEGPVTSRRSAPDKGEVDFMFDPAYASILKKIGITAVSQANNHTLDQGRAGADESRKLLIEAGITVFGDQVKDDTASALAIIETRGHKVALLGFNNTDNPLNKVDAEVAIKSAYEQARYVVVYMHWGNEYQSNPTMAQVELAHWFIDLGVDAVIGGHPHWMQSVEVYKNRPIVYSLGNFIFDQDWSVETNFGLVAGLVLSPDGSDVHLFPIQIKQSQPVILQNQDRQSRLDRLANISHSSLSEQIKSGILPIKH
jgi:poly-gamma-glutamate synthesis protein (capsule biosynthesis protein)